MSKFPRASSPVAGILATGALVVTAAGVILTLAAATLAAIMAHRIVTPPPPRTDDTRIDGVDIAGGSIRLQANSDSVLPGDYGLWFSGGIGHARVGAVLDRAPGRVTRRLLGVDFGDLTAATTGRLSGWLHLGPWDFGLPWENVLVPTPLGLAPAWLIPADPAADSAADPAASGRWVIQVHGRSVTRHEALRAVPVFQSAGYTSLLVSYRNDGEAPESPGGRYGLGDTEWRDVDAAVSFALDHGAQSVVLMGWSMGGAIVLQTATRSDHRARIRGLVLDSPVISWADVLVTQARSLRLPGAVAHAAMAILGHRWGAWLTTRSDPIDFRRLDFVTRSAQLSVPILLMHSDDDGYVPASGSRALAKRRPDLVTWRPFAVARHTKLWNYDPEGWNTAITTWLRALEPSERNSSRNPPAAADAD